MKPVVSCIETQPTQRGELRARGGTSIGSTPSIGHSPLGAGILNSHRHSVRSTRRRGHPGAKEMGLDRHLRGPSRTPATYSTGLRSIQETGTPTAQLRLRRK